MRKKEAFTMLELILVIVVMGILAAYSIPRFKRDTRIEAINHMLTMIRYTQNLALHDSKHLTNNSYWQRTFWRFEIKRCRGETLFYLIGTDSDLSNTITRNETAIDPSNGKLLYWATGTSCPKNDTKALSDNVSPNIFITRKYGINNVTFRSCSLMIDGRSTSISKKHIGFDNFGRPIRKYTTSNTPNYNGHAKTNCKITFSFEDNSIAPFTIVVPPESGYAYLEENRNL